MTEEEMNQRFALLAEAVSRVADASSSGIRQLIDGQLALQRLGGQLSDVVLEVRQEVLELKREQQEFRQEQQEFRQEQQALRQRQADSDQRFEILLQEIRFLAQRNGEAS